MTNLDSMFKSRDITLPTKVHLVKAMAFPVVMYGCESWTVKKAERRRIEPSCSSCTAHLCKVWYLENTSRVTKTEKKGRKILYLILYEFSIHSMTYSTACGKTDLNPPLISQ